MSVQKVRFWSAISAVVFIVLVAGCIIGAIWAPTPLSGTLAKIGASFFIMFLLSLFFKMLQKAMLQMLPRAMLKTKRGSVVDL